MNRWAGPLVLSLRRLGVVRRDETAAALAPRAGNVLRRPAETGDDPAGAAAGGAALGVVRLGLRAHRCPTVAIRGREERPRSRRALRRRRPAAPDRPTGRSGASGAASAGPRG